MVQGFLYGSRKRNTREISGKSLYAGDSLWYDTCFAIGCIVQEQAPFISAIGISRSKEILSLLDLGIKAELGTEIPDYLSCLFLEKFLGMV